MSFASTILFAEDSEDDMLLIRRGFEKSHLPFALYFVEDGVLAVDYLSGKKQYADRIKFPIPSMLLTDLKMPRMDGFELLAWVRAQNALENLPIVVITGSDQSEDRRRALDLGASAYVTKELLMHPPAGLIDSMLRLCDAPSQSDPRKAWRRMAQRNLAG